MDASLVKLTLGQGFNGIRSDSSAVVMVLHRRLRSLTKGGMAGQSSITRYVWHPAQALYEPQEQSFP